MAKQIIHISEAEVASNFAAAMARVRAGAEVVIEDDVQPVAVLRPAETAGALAVRVASSGNVTHVTARQSAILRR